MSNHNVGAVGMKQSGSASNDQSPIYEVPYGTVQLASSSKMEGSTLDLASGFTGINDFENQEEDEDEEGEDDEGDSEDGGGKGSGKGGKKGKRQRSEAKGERDLKTGRRKIKIEFIEDDARRHITFSKRKAGIMKKAYELATLTGTQVLLLVVSQTGLVYTFTTPKLQALVTQAEGRNLIQACLNAPDPPQHGNESGNEDQSGEDGSENDDGISPSESQTSSNKRGAAAGKKRSRKDSASKSSAASNTAVAGVDEEVGAATTVIGKRGRGRPRKNTLGSAAGQTDANNGAVAANVPSTAASSVADSSHSQPPPLMHQSYSDDAVQQQQHQQQAYGHVNPTEYAGFGGAGSNYFADSSHGAGGSNGGMDFGHQQQQQHTAHPGGVPVDPSQSATAWNPNMSPATNTQAMFGNDHHQQQQQYGFQGAAQHPHAHHFGHFNPQQIAGMQPQEIQAPRPAW